jgi:hypothetical protein
LHSRAPGVIVREFVHGAFVRPYVQTRGLADADNISTGSSRE